MRRGRRGFTLIELLVVIVIIAILAFALAVLVVELLTRSRYDKTIAIVHTLDKACNNYWTECKEFPPTTPYAGSANLHFYLGRKFKYPVQFKNDGSAALTKDHDPYIKFKPDWLQGSPDDPDPLSGGAKQIVDAWSQPVDYLIILPDKKQVWIRSKGADQAAECSQTNTNHVGDDVDNRHKEY